MVSAALLRTIASYVGFPLLASVAFILITIWFCKVFQRNVIVHIPEDNGQRRNDQGVNLRPLAGAMIFFLIKKAYSSSDGICKLKGALAKLSEELDDCELNKNGLKKFQEFLCESITSTPTIKFEDFYPLIFSLLAIALAIVIFWVIRKRNQAPTHVAT